MELAARVVDEPVALLARDAGMAAELFNLAGRRPGSLNDCMIAATALRAGASVATRTSWTFAASSGPPRHDRSESVESVERKRHKRPYRYATVSGTRSGSSLALRTDR
jgi:hypothetical protein